MSVFASFWPPWWSTEYSTIFLHFPLVSPFAPIFPTSPHFPSFPPFFQLEREVEREIEVPPWAGNQGPC